MDIPANLILRGVGFGLREAYHATRVLHWADYDRRHPVGAGWAPELVAGNPTGRMRGTGRNAPGGPRDRVIRGWGKSGEWWARRWAPGPRVPQPLAERLRAGENFRMMDGHSPAELRLHNQYAVENGIYQPAADLMQQIRMPAAAAGPYARLHARLTNPNLRLEAEKNIIDIYANMWHRTKQMDWFREKIEVQLKIAKKVEKVHIHKFLMQMQNKLLHDLNDKMQGILQKLMKLLGAFR